ncbi:MAG: fimbrial protein [Enterobacterales bacterium]|uniref:fimbrial protein n=1 Tax=Serratia sp. (in: enterobacteria) TaxID=616 RepID=UPI003F3D9B9F
MIKIHTVPLAMALGFIISLPAMAINSSTSKLILSPANISFTGNADSVVFGEPMSGPTTTRTSLVFGCTIFSNCNRATVRLDSSIVPSGITATVAGITYGVYETGVPGIGFIIGVKDHNASTYIPLTDAENETWRGSAPQMGFDTQVHFIKTGNRLVTGSITTPQITAAILTGYDTWGAQAQSQIIINPMTVTTFVNGCTVDQSALNFPMGEISEKVFNGVGSLSEGVTATASLHCDANVTVAVVLTDQSDTSNTSSTIGLTPASEARGVGVQFFAHGQQLMSLGPDSSLKGTTGQIQLSTTQQNNSIITLPLTAKYVQTGEITPGSANAIASLTFSYQ